MKNIRLFVNKNIRWGMVGMILIGVTIGVLINFTSNDSPSPKKTHAAKLTNTPTPTLTPKPTVTPTPTAIPSFSISGSIFIDTSGNGKFNDIDSNYTVGATVSAVLNGIPKGSDISGANGKYSIAGLPPGDYTITLSVPDGYRTTTDNPVSENITVDNIKGEKFGIIPTIWNIPTNEKFVMCRDLHQFVKDHCN